MGLREAISERRCAFGGWCSIPSPFSAELLGAAGYDYVCIDCQHGLIGYDAFVPMLQALSRTAATPIVRVPSNDWSWIGKALDAGAEGVIVPMVSSRSDAERAARACMFPPDGDRSFGPVRAGIAGTFGRPPLCFVMIENTQGLAAADEICTTPGVSGVYIGPADLAVSLGLRPTVSPSEAAHLDAIARVRKACADAGIASGIHGASGVQGAAYAADGFAFVTIASDAGLVQAGSAREIAATRDRTAQPEPRSDNPYG